MTSKKLFKEPSNCVVDMLDGLKACYPGLIVNSQLGLTVLNEDRGNKVALFSGGGSGHEPFPAGYVAPNMLTGAVSGLVFSSPSVSNIFSGINYLSQYNKGGVLAIIMNYTGDKLNFGLAIERAKNAGLKVDSITVNDDCALIGHDDKELVGKRGILGCAFVFKILGALSDSGSPLSRLKSESHVLLGRLASMGVCLEACSLPAAKEESPLFHLGQGEISIGCGVHGEAGIATIQMCSLPDLVGKVLTKIFETEILKYGNNVCVLIGNLGATTQMEILIVAKEVKQQLNERGVTVERLYAGTLMSSLDMKGFQVSVLNSSDKEHWLSCLDLPTEGFAWPATNLSCTTVENEAPISWLPSVDTKQFSGLKLEGPEARTFKECVLFACEALKSSADEINRLDSECGDGDCGTTLANFAECILASKNSLSWFNVGQCLGEMSGIAETEMGGTSGAVYSLLLQGAARGTATGSWPRTWSAGLDLLAEYSPARPGHRTLVDALAPACDAFKDHLIEHGDSQWREALKLALQKANEGCANTLSLTPKLGRAVYAESSRISSVDAGAFGVTVWLGAIADYLLTKS